mmetsp:Transcript_35176/g.105042  ORF Transcript_35176/g.105042 Transcript_35176/m.105042 type:complete len:130 (+) Transcript_35176:1339-1728(+)
MRTYVNNKILGFLTVLLHGIKGKVWVLCYCGMIDSLRDRLHSLNWNLQHCYHAGHVLVRKNNWGSQGLSYPPSEKTGDDSSSIPSDTPTSVSPSSFWFASQKFFIMLKQASTSSSLSFILIGAVHLKPK